MSIFDKPKCPICGTTKFRSSVYYEEMGRVEEHTYCEQCGYTVEMAYGPTIVGFRPTVTKGRRNKYDGKFYPKNIRKRARLHRKFNIKRNSNKDRMLLYI